MKKIFLAIIAAVLISACKLHPTQVVGMVDLPVFEGDTIKI